MYPGKWAQEFPEKSAAIHAVTGATITYRELNDRSNQLAQLMWADGLRAGDHAAILMENNLRYFEVVWAALRSGLYITTINRYLTNEEAGYILENCEAKILVASSSLAEIARDLARHAPDCERWLMVDDTILLDPFADGDFDGNEAVDLDDYGQRSACETGPLDEFQVIGCDVFDFDADNDVDLEDYGEFQLSFTG